MATKEEKRLKDFLFGSKIDGFELDNPDNNDVDTSSLFVIDRQGKEISNEPSSKKVKKSIDIESVPAWKDEEDDQTEVDIANSNSLYRKLRNGEQEVLISAGELNKRLNKQMNKMHPQLQLNNENNSSFRIKNENLIHTALPSKLLKFNRLTDANKQDYSQSVLQTVKFHPNSERLLLTAGLDCTLRLFNIDGEINSNIQSVVVDDLPIMKAHFGTNEILITGRRKYYYTFDLIKNNINRVNSIKFTDIKSLESFCVSPDEKYIAFFGAHGNIILLAYKNKQLITTLKMNGEVRAGSFSYDSKFLYTIGTEGKIYIWDLLKQQCIRVFDDEGCITGTSISISSNDQFVATGSDSGIVNVYNNNFLTTGSSPKPIKFFKNLTTPIDEVIFSPDSQLLSAYSHRKKSALRMIYIPTLSVYPDWPTSKTPLSYVSAMDFSHANSYCAIGNDKGKCLLFNIQDKQ